MPSVYFIQLRLNYICNFYHCQAFSFKFFQNISITCRCRLPIQKQEVFPGEIFMRFSLGKRQKAEPKGSASCLLSVFTAGHLGQKHSRPARLEHFAVLLVSSCAKPCFFRPRRRRALRRLTAAAAVNQSRRCVHKRRKPRKRDAFGIPFSWLAPPVGLEPTTPRLTAACSTD